MEIIIYQTIIFLSIFFSRIAGESVAIIFALGWAIFTIVMVFSAPLLVLQFITITIAFNAADKVFGNFAPSDVEGKNDYPAAGANRFAGNGVDYGKISASRPAFNYHVSENREILGASHREFLCNTIKNAEGELVILTGWISHKVVDESFLQLIDGALSHGCTVYIGYGFVDRNGRHTSTWRSEKAVGQLLDLNLDNRGRGKIYLKMYPNHEKLLVSSEGVCVFGSFNWLSTTNYKNSERSIVIENEDLARSEIIRVKKIFESEIA